MLGVDEERFWESIPVELDPYRKMDEMQQERLDYNMWMMGVYVTQAVGVAVNNQLKGNKSRAKYFDKPFSMIDREEQERSPADDLMRFSAWVAVYNENFIRTHKGQGE